MNLATPLRCATCGWQIGCYGTHTGRYREVEGWVCVFCLSRFVEINEQTADEDVCFCQSREDRGPPGGRCGGCGCLVLEDE